MLSLVIHLRGDGAFPDLAGKLGTDKVLHLGNGSPPVQVAALESGLASGKPSVMLRFDLPDGRVVLAETSLALFLTAADAFRGRYGDPRIEAPPVAAAPSSGTKH